MGKWFPRLYDTFMAPLEKKKQFKEIRKSIVSKATGEVLEIGSGTGINFPLYEHADHVVAIEPNPYMVKKSNLNLEQAKVAIEVKEASAEKLAFADNSFDSVVATLVFCTIPNPQKALTEIHRLLKPGGKFLLFEHVKMDNPVLAALQNGLTPVWKHLCDGCHLNRNTLSIIQNSSFHIEQVKSYYKGLFIVIEARTKYI